MSLDQIPDDVRFLYEIHEWNHAVAILTADFPKEWEDILQVLRGFTLTSEDIVAKGGSKSRVAARIDGAFYSLGWEEKQFLSHRTVDEVDLPNPTHKIDCYKNRVGVEIEWSNKDPFYDRDLNNFRILFDLGAISIGVIITKSEDLKPLFRSMNLYKKYGASTTWMGKLLPRILGGGAGGCPILVFGIGKDNFQEEP